MMTLIKKIVAIGLSILTLVTPCFAQTPSITNHHTVEVLQEDKIEVVKAMSKQDQYLNYLNALAIRLNNELSYLYDNGGTVEAVEASSREYKAWDDALNEIYGVLKTELSTNEMNKLRQAQRN